MDRSLFPSHRRILWPLFYAALLGSQTLVFGATSRPAHRSLSWTPLRLSAWPYSNGIFPYSIPCVRGLSLGLTVSHDDAVYGLQASPLGHVDRGGGIQVGAAPEAGRFHGIQVGILSASAKAFYGLQVSPLNNLDIARTKVRGIQVGVINGGDDVKGLQIAAANRGRAMRGLQAGVVNGADTIAHGAQVGLVNLIYQKKSQALQVGFMNIGESAVSGLQIGFFNSCRTLRGVQIGVFNRVTERRFLWGTLPLINAGW